MTDRMPPPAQVSDAAGADAMPADDPPAFRPPPPDLFARRARRALALAAGHDLEPLLRFAADLARHQQAALDRRLPLDPPPRALLDACRAVGMPPLAPPAWQPEPPWPTLARDFAGAMLEDPELRLPMPSRAALERIRAASDDWLWLQARALLDPSVSISAADGEPGADLTRTGDAAVSVSAADGDSDTEQRNSAVSERPPVADLPNAGGTASQLSMTDGDPVTAVPDLAGAPLIGAALQVAWTAQALTLEPAELGPPAHAALCPACGAPPVAGILRAGGGLDGLRYLHCGLCGGEWRLTRSQCSQCGNSREMTYANVAGWGKAVTAETCPECRSYLKLCRMEDDPGVDPWADDLATLALDWLVDREGFGRAGMNFMLLMAPAAEAGPGSPGTAAVS